MGRAVPTLDVDVRTEENYRAHLRNHILPRWQATPLGGISALAVTTWRKQLRNRLAAATVAGITTVFSMMLDDAVDERLIPANPVHRRRRRGRRRDHAPSAVERVWAMPEQVIRIAEHAAVLGGPSGGLLVITAAWTGCRWGELAGLQRDHVRLDPHRNRGVLIVDPDTGALHESGSELWLGPPKTPASARTITLPPFLVVLLREHLAETCGEFVFTSRRGCRLRRSTFDRRVLRPAVDGDPRRDLSPVRPGLTFHGLRHSHKTWLIADGIPEIAQARRLGHHLSNRLVETYSHVAPEVEHRVLTTLEQRWRQAQRLRKPVDNRPPQRHSARRAPHRHPVLCKTPHRRTINGRPPAMRAAGVRTPGAPQLGPLLISSSWVHPGDHERPFDRDHGASERGSPTRRNADPERVDQGVELRGLEPLTP
ncbi:MAG TPA: site-specific integrase, partial [Micromonosporaceae bacterium]|nr:site-specific integrase [Micromonosporaceae bacterium]